MSQFFIYEMNLLYLLPKDVAFCGGNLQNYGIKEVEFHRMIMWKSVNQWWSERRKQSISREPRSLWLRSSDLWVMKFWFRVWILQKQWQLYFRLLYLFVSWVICFVQLGSTWNRHTRSPTSICESDSSRGEVWAQTILLTSWLLKVKTVCW